VSRRPLTVLVLGRGEVSVVSKDVEVCSLGFVQDERRLVLAYSAADLMVHPAPVDNLPNVVMESIACGTPCVGFPIGGVLDMVRPGLTGWLADTVSPEALGVAIDDAIANIGDGQDLRASCRAVAEHDYGDRLQARRYLMLYESLRGGGRLLREDTTKAERP
jgi:glycosyltransferase involved in cell wall biosynthesis